MKQDDPARQLPEPQDEDVDAPTFEDLEFFAALLRNANPRSRLKGPQGEALKELAEIERILKDRTLSADERVVLGERLWTLNGRTAINDQEVKETRGPLGAGPIWRPKNRPIGAPSRTIDIDLDYQMIERAKELFKSKGSLKPAFRESVEEAVRAGKLAKNLEIDSHIKRLERKTKKQRLIP